MRGSLAAPHQTPSAQRACEEVVPEAVGKRLLPYPPDGSAAGRPTALVTELSIHRHSLGSEKE